MKKRGSTLATVLIIFSALLVLGTSVSSAVVNTNKFNAKYSENIDLELAAKSGLNIFKEELIRNIKSVSNSSALPLGVAKCDSGIIDFEDISITKEIIRDDIKENGLLAGYKYTIISTAIDMSDYKEVGEAEANNATQKKESQVITVNIDNEGYNSDSTDNDYDLSIFKNYINIGNNISIGTNNSNTSYTKNSAYGNSCEVGNNSSGYEPKYESELKNISFSINQKELSKIMNQFNTNQIESINTSNNIDIKDKECVKFNGLNINSRFVSINNSKVMFDGNSSFMNSNTFSQILNSIIVFNGDVYSNDKIQLPIVQNSIIIINGNFTINNGLSMEKFENSVLLVTGNLNIPATSGYKINLISSNIIIDGSVFSQNGLNINLDNSIFIANKSFNFGNGLNGSSNNSSLICNEDMYIQNVNNNFTCTGKTYPQNTDVLKAFYKYILVL